MHTSLSNLYSRGGSVAFVVLAGGGGLVAGVVVAGGSGVGGAVKYERLEMLAEEGGITCEHECTYQLTRRLVSRRLP